MHPFPSLSLGTKNKCVAAVKPFKSGGKIRPSFPPPPDSALWDLLFMLLPLYHCFVKVHTTKTCKRDLWLLGVEQTRNNHTLNGKH